MKAPLTRTAAGLATSLAFAASALGTTLRFDELASQPADGLSVGGVTFGFEVGGAPSADATYNVDLGLGSTAHTADALLEGDAAGILTLEFTLPTNELSFGLLLLSGADYTPGAVVDLYDAASLLVDSVSVDTLADLGLGISEGWFNWSDPLSSITRAVVDFDDAGGRFGVDNLSFVPEPTPLVGSLALAGFALASFLRRRQA